MTVKVNRVDSLLLFCVLSSEDKQHKLINNKPSHLFDAKSNLDSH
jgi:hypothetical protein